jgi:hypothetical protein
MMMIRGRQDQDKIAGELDSEISMNASDFTITLLHIMFLLQYQNTLIKQYLHLPGHSHLPWAPPSHDQSTLHHPSQTSQ